MLLVGIYFLTGFVAAIGTTILGVCYSLHRKHRKYGVDCVKMGFSCAAICFAAFATIAVRGADADARFKGFDDAEDQRRALDENYTDASLWHSVQKERRQAAAVLKANELRKKRDLEQQAIETRAQADRERLIAEARARAEQERLAAEARARAEQERLAAEARARAEQERLAAEARARAEQERLAAEARARAEQERLAAEARARAEQERLAAEARARAEQERLAAEARARAEQERLAAEARARAEQERLAAEAQAASDYYNTKMKQLYAQSTLRSITLLGLSLKDASSAAIQNYNISKLPDGRVALCGYINGKNSFGLYTGFRRFVVAADLDVAEFEGSTQDATFESAWNNWCVNRDE